MVGHVNLHFPNSSVWIEMMDQLHNLKIKVKIEFIKIISDQLIVDIYSDTLTNIFYDHQ